MKPSVETPTTTDLNVDKKIPKATGPIKVFPTTYYRGCPIYRRKWFNKFWEYITVIGGEVYTAHYVIYPVWWRKLLYYDPFTKHQTRVCLHLLEKAAETTIEIILGKEVGKNNR